MSGYVWGYSLVLTFAFLVFAACAAEKGIKLTYSPDYDTPQPHAGRKYMRLSYAMITLSCAAIAWLFIAGCVTGDPAAVSVAFGVVFFFHLVGYANASLDESCAKAEQESAARRRNRRRLEMEL